MKGVNTENLDEAAFLAAYDASAFPRPSVAVDVVAIAILSESLRTLMVRRAVHPARGRWALPGGFVGIEESLDAAARRVLAAKTQLTDVFLEQLYTFGAVDRDPRMRIISVAYYALIAPPRLDTVALSDHARFQTIGAAAADSAATDVGLLDELGAPLEVAFDHRAIVAMALTRLRGKLDYAPIGYALLPPVFTLLGLQRVHEIILGKHLNKDSFRRRMLASGELVPTGTLQDGVDHRPAALYRHVSQGATA